MWVNMVEEEEGMGVIGWWRSVNIVMFVVLCIIFFLFEFYVGLGVWYWL